ncbi:helix-turn-helix domain-containing protein [Desulfolutivibrio sulfodismutans]|uniref:helix-turn-helix domain-containing protein n=1 Tax=Desulfolutivibrio sulfodismutans TaxID=63561 RepID=UPI0034A4609B
MVRRGLRVTDVAQGAGVDKSYVSHFLAGRRRGRVVREYLIRIGCPATFLGEDVRKVA